ncbi:MAG: PqqD family protein [Alphaproteobacteria bacterium]
MAEPVLSLSSRVRHREVGDEGVLVHLDNGRVIVVNEVGLHIVQALAEPRTRGELAASVASAFDVSVDRAAADLETYLVELEREQILEQGA